MPEYAVIYDYDRDTLDRGSPTDALIVVLAAPTTDDAIEAFVTMMVDDVVEYSCDVPRVIAIAKVQDIDAPSITSKIGDGVRAAKTVARKAAEREADLKTLRDLVRKYPSDAREYAERNS